MQEIEPDLWEAVLTAGACRRAARADKAKAAYWLGLADEYSRRAATLLAYDVVGWRWPQMTPGR